MKQKITKGGQRTVKYRARFNGDYDREVALEFRAVNEFQARKIAEGIAKKELWTVKSVGTI